MANKLVRKLFGDTLYFKVLWALLVLLKINYIIDSRTTPLFIFLIGYGTLIILYDLFTGMKFLGNKHIALVILLLLFVGISTIINYKNGFIENMKFLISTSIQFLVIARIDTKKSRDTMIKEMYLLNKILVIGITITTLISLGLVAFGINGTYTMFTKGAEKRELIYSYGVVSSGTNSGRLVGIYTNSNRLGVYAAIAIMFSIINLNLKQNKVINKIGYYLSIVLNYLCLVLSDSRSSILSLVFSVTLMVFMWLLVRFKKENNPVTKYLKTMAICAVSIGLLYGATTLTRVAFNSFSENNGSKIIENESLESESQLTDFELGRTDGIQDLDINKVSSGRLKIWKIGFNTVRQKPIFGVGLYNLYNAVKENWDKGVTPLAVQGGGMHNMYIETMVAYGVPTFLILLLIMILVFQGMLKVLWKTLKTYEDFYFYGSLILGILGFILTNNLFESRMLFFTNLSSFVFMLYLGYGVYFIQTN